MRHIRKLVILGSFFSLSAISIGQESISILDNHYYIPDGKNYLDQELYGLALQDFEADIPTDLNIAYSAKSSFLIDETRSIDLLLESVARSSDAKSNNETYAIIANKYFEKKSYNTSRDYFKKVNTSLLTKDQYEEVNFKLAYTYLLEKNFREALSYFSKSKKYNGSLSSDANYYSGICQYYLNQKDKSIASFESVQNHKRYKDIIPYYLAQIYFKDGQYIKAIDYSKKQLNSSKSRNTELLNKILGLSYLVLEEYDDALIYLDKYAASANKLTENEFYQIAVTHYKLGNYDKSKELFSELSHQATPIGQVSNYLLGSLNLNDESKKNAQSAFKQASKYDFYPDTQDESQFLYYKISAELGEERVAMNGLANVQDSSPYYDESQALLAQLLIRSSDHVIAIQTIEGLKTKKPEILEAYQSVTYDYALINLEQGLYGKAIQFLDISKSTPGSEDIKQSCDFWLAHAHDKRGDSKNSDAFINVYLNGGHQDYRFEAQYLKAYHNIKAKNFDGAKMTLENAMGDFDINQDDKLLFDDAIVRLADLELLENNYTKAIEYYDLAISNGAEESDYILFQKALIYGVINDDLEKLTSLESLIKDSPNSQYRDDAFFEIGESLMSLKKNNEAFKVYSSLVAEFGDNSDFASLSYLRKGLISYNQGDINSALKFYKKGLQLSGDADHQRQALLAIEEIYLRDLNDPEGYFEFAEEEIGFEFDAFTRDSLSYHGAYQSYTDSDFRAAITGFSNYIQKFNSGYYLQDATYFLAESYVLEKDYVNSLTYYEKLTSDEASKYYQSSVKKAALIAFNHINDFEKSHFLFRKWFEFETDPKIDIVESALYSAHMVSKDPEVISYGNQLVAHKETTKEKVGAAYFYIGRSNENLGNQDEAISAYNKVIQNVNNNQSAEASYRVSKIFFDKDLLDKSESQAFETTKHAANYPFWVAKSLILIGDIYVVRKDFLNASAAYESVIENFPENPEILQESTSKLESLNKMIEESSRVKTEGQQLNIIQQDGNK